MVTSQLPLNIVSFASPSFCETLQAALHRLDWQAHRVSGGDWLTQTILSNGEHVILAVDSADYPRDRLLSVLRTRRITPALGVVSGHPTCWDSEILAHCGEFLRWPCPLEELSLRLNRGCSENGFALKKQNPSFEEFANLNLIGQSPAFLEILQLIKKLSSCEAPVLIEGETGTGKEVAARAIHFLGERRSQAFVPVNCGAMPEHLLENELFGHERGAYTDARDSQTGLIAQANHGTLFLDEVDVLSPKGQAALLRFLQDQEYKPLGGGMLKQSNVRVIAASNTDLNILIERGAFRQDLFFRLNVMMLGLPALRDRRSDIELLADYFLDRYCAHYRQPKKPFHPAVLTWMRNYPWPGNVRELENFVHRALLLSDGSFIQVPPMPSHSGAGGSSHLTELPQDRLRQAKAYIIDQFEKQYLKQLMGECHGNITLAAKRAGKERRALGKLLKKHRIDRFSYLV